MKNRNTRSRFLALCAGLVSLAGWSAQSVSAAITIVQPAGANYVESVALTNLPPGATGTVKLNPIKPLAVLAPPAGGSLFMTTFAADVGQYPGWTAATGAALAGTLTINTYKARDDGNPRGGADMTATYVPAEAEAAMSFAWIQVYTDNAGPGGALRKHIDPWPNDGTDKGPFYYNSDEGIVNLVFDDHPWDNVSSIPFNRTVTFETYLSTFDSNTKVATIHDGYSWGYTITAIPEPGSLVGVACMLASVLAIRTRRQLRRAAMP
jgi:hypothetical protein